MLIVTSIHPNDICTWCGRERGYGEHFIRVKLTDIFDDIGGYACSKCWYEKKYNNNEREE